MKKILVSLVRQFVFWILFFDFSRLVFLLYYLKIINAENIPFTEVTGVFWHSLRLDAGTACYLLVIPFLILLVQSFYNFRWLNVINKIYSGLMIFFYSLTAAGEMGIYSEWKTKLTYKVLKYFMHPSEIYNSAGTSTFFILLVILIFLFLAGFFAYTKLFYTEIHESPRKWWFSLVFMVVMFPVLFIGMRGGVQQIPINQSQSFYSRHTILNMASVNNFFNLYISVFENLANFNKDPYVFMKPEEARRLVADIYRTRKDTTINILKNRRPNIVILIMESWSADLIEDLGGEPGITPEFKELEKNGILFDQIYATGSRSEQGMASIFSGFPAHQVSSITVQPDKYMKLPSMVKILKKEGYHTSFYFGGQLIYGNMRGYMMFNEFDRITEGENFPSAFPRGKLGIHDQYTLNYQLQQLNKEPVPFFSSLFTVSTHSPWDQPYPKPLKWGDNEHEYINAAYYTDHCLGEYFRKAKQEPWFDNTLFIIVADHSHNSYRNWHPLSQEYHRIPMLFYGNVIKDQYKGKKWSKMGNHNDIPATLLAQLHLSAKSFQWSKNLFNPYTPDFAYIASDDGGGWIRPDAFFSFDVPTNYFHFCKMNTSIQDSIIREGKAYMQAVFSQYLEY
ncbi:MAG: sulfatase-like hydrolase/transferase [Bacteroidota bacterium]|nr:sulfatase-like hydrolase/transferase [Bacteroidota bacterium]